MNLLIDTHQMNINGVIASLWLVIHRFIQIKIVLNGYVNLLENLETRRLLQ